MRKFLTGIFLVFSCLTGHRALAVSADGSFIVGYNEAWFAGYYGTGLTANFDPAYVARIFEQLSRAGGQVVRLFLFELRQGWRMDAKSARISGLEPSFLRNLETVLTVARSRGLKVYVTLLEGNELRASQGEVRAFYEKFLNDQEGVPRAFHEMILVPLLKTLSLNRDVVYALDLMNEIQAPVDAGLFRAHWFGARGWIQRTAGFVKAQAPWLKVTSSSGWGSAVRDLTWGFFSGLGLDFYDVHVYSDTGDYVGATALCERAARDGLPIILGEFGQDSHEIDDDLQYRVTERFLATAKQMCFSAALAWRFDPEEKWWSYQRRDGSFRPAVKLMQQFSSRKSARPRASGN